MHFLEFVYELHSVKNRVFIFNLRVSRIILGIFRLVDFSQHKKIKFENGIPIEHSVENEERRRRRTRKISCCKPKRERKRCCIVKGNISPCFFPLFFESHDDLMIALDNN